MNLMTRATVIWRRLNIKEFRRSDRAKTATAADTTKKETHMLMPMLAEMSGSIHVAAAALGAAIGVGLIGGRASEAVGRNPGAATQILVQAILSTAFAEGIVFFAIYLVKQGP